MKRYWIFYSIIFISFPLCGMRLRTNSVDIDQRKVIEQQRRRDDRRKKASLPLTLRNKEAPSFDDFIKSNDARTLAMFAKLLVKTSAELCLEYLQDDKKVCEAYQSIFECYDTIGLPKEAEASNVVCYNNPLFVCLYTSILSHIKSDAAIHLNDNRLGPLKAKLAIINENYQTLLAKLPKKNRGNLPPMLNLLTLGVYAAIVNAKAKEQYEIEHYFSPEELPFVFKKNIKNPSINNNMSRL